MLERVKSATFDAWFRGLLQPTGSVNHERCARNLYPFYLKTEVGIAAYLEACAEEAPNDAAFMLKALGTVARARNMSQLAEAAGMTRVGLYKALSGEGNPGLANTMKVAKALGYRLALVPVWIERLQSIHSRRS